MMEPQTLPIGPFLLPMPLLISLLLLGLAAKASERILPFGETGPSWTGRVIQACLLYFLLRKFSPLLWEPGLILQRPLSLLFAMGSFKGAMVAFFVAVAYLIGSARKEGQPVPKTLDRLALTGLIAGIGYSVIFIRWGEATRLPWGMEAEEGGLLYHPVHVYRVLALGAVLVLWWKRRHRFPPGKTFAWMATWSGIGLLLVSYTDYFPMTAALGLSRSQWWFVLLAISGWLAGWGPEIRARIRRMKTVSPADDGK